MTTWLAAAPENAWLAGEGMVSITWGPDVAGVYDATYAAGFAPSVLEPVAGLLASLAGTVPCWSSRWGPGGWPWR